MSNRKSSKQTGHQNSRRIGTLSGQGTQKKKSNSSTVPKLTMVPENNFAESKQKLSIKAFQLYGDLARLIENIMFPLKLK